MGFGRRVLVFSQAPVHFFSLALFFVVFFFFLITPFLFLLSAFFVRGGGTARKHGLKLTGREHQKRGWGFALSGFHGVVSLRRPCCF